MSIFVQNLGEQCDLDDMKLFNCTVYHSDGKYPIRKTYINGWYLIDIKPTCLGGNTYKLT